MEAFRRNGKIQQGETAPFQTQKLIPTSALYSAIRLRYSTSLKAILPITESSFSELMAVAL